MNKYKLNHAQGHLYTSHDPKHQPLKLVQPKFLQNISRTPATSVCVCSFMITVGNLIGPSVLCFIPHTYRKMLESCFI